MYGIIGMIKSKPGQRDALIKVLLQGSTGMPGCLSYIVSMDSDDPDAIWVTEVWTDQQSHRASLATPTVQKAIEIGRPLIAEFGGRYETQPVGGIGLS